MSERHDPQAPWPVRTDRNLELTVLAIRACLFASVALYFLVLPALLR